MSASDELLEADNSKQEALDSGALPPVLPASIRMGRGPVANSGILSRADY